MSILVSSILVCYTNYKLFAFANGFVHAQTEIKITENILAKNHFQLAEEFCTFFDSIFFKDSRLSIKRSSIFTLFFITAFFISIVISSEKIITLTPSAEALETASSSFQSGLIEDVEKITVTGSLVMSLISIFLILWPQNIAFDFVSLYQTRKVLELIKSGKLGLKLALSIDFSVSLLIILIGISIFKFTEEIISGLFYMDFWYEFTVDPIDSLIYLFSEGEIFFEFFSGYLAISFLRETLEILAGGEADISTRIAACAACAAILTTFSTSIWLWLYVSSRYFSEFFEFFINETNLKVVAIHENILKILGVISSAVLFVLLVWAFFLVHILMSLFL